MADTVEEDQERVVLGQREDTFAGFSWTGAEPEGLSDPEEAEEYGAVCEGDELVTYNLDALTGEFQSASEEQFLEDVD